MRRVYSSPIRAVHWGLFHSLMMDHFQILLIIRKFLALSCPQTHKHHLKLFSKSLLFKANPAFSYQA